MERASKPKASRTKRPKEAEEEDRQVKRLKLEEAAVHSPLDHITVEPSAEVAQAGGQMNVDHVEIEEDGDGGNSLIKQR